MFVTAALVSRNIPVGSVAVIFTAQRTDRDDAAYEAAAQRMEELAYQQPGFVAVESVRGDDGLGITVSYWKNDADAKAWRDNAEHAEMREQGRARWYSAYTLYVARVERGYQWP